MDNDPMWGRCYSVQHIDSFDEHYIHKNDDQIMKPNPQIYPERYGVDNIKKDSKIMTALSMRVLPNINNNKSNYNKQKARLQNAWRDSTQTTSETLTTDGLSPYERKKAVLSNAWKGSK